MARGLKKRLVGAAASTRSPRKAAACWRNKRRPGRRLLRPSAGSRETTMPEPAGSDESTLRAGWRREVLARLSSLRLSPTREAEIVDELSQHLDDHYRELIAGGSGDGEAARLVLAEFRSG